MDNLLFGARKAAIPSKQDQHAFLKQEAHVRAMKVLSSQEALEEQQHLAEGGKVHRNGIYETWHNKQGQLHRERGPAYHGEDEISWRQNGELHRTNGPAVIYPYGGESWYQNGLAHRDNGPARIFSDDRLEWYHQGRLHRQGAPAVIEPNGTEIWYQNGVRHRTDGPAVVEISLPQVSYNFTIKLPSFLSNQPIWFLFGQGYQDEREWIKAKQARGL